MCLLGLARVRDAPMQSEGRSCVPGEGHFASEPPTLSSALPPPDALPSRNVTQGQEGQAGGGRKGFFSICRGRGGGRSGRIFKQRLVGEKRDS